MLQLTALTSPASTDTITYQWSATSGVFDDPTQLQVQWTARRNPLEAQDVTFTVYARSPYFTASASLDYVVLPSATIAGRINTDDKVDLLVTQWDDATRLRALLNAILAVIDEQLVAPLADLETTTRIATAEGAWLDRIGERLGSIRPHTLDTTFARFGFDSAGVGFDQGPFSTTIAGLAATVPVGDEYFRCILKHPLAGAAGGRLGAGA